MPRHKSRTGPDKQRDSARAPVGALVVLDSNGDVIYVTAPDVADALRYFIARVQATGDLGLPQTLALTSALAGEGVSYVARSLAAVVAHDLKRKVCLVETNWWKPTGKGGTAEGDHPGLAEVLAGNVDLDTALVPTDSPHLSILGAGKAPPQDRPVLARSSALSDLLADISKEFDTVLLDVPPVLRVSESITLARQADATALVVRQGVTTERQVRAAFEELTGIQVLGTILNRSSTKIPRLLRRLALPS